MREKPKTEEEAKAAWEMVSDAIQRIYLKKTGDLKYQDLFDVFHKLTLSQFADKVSAWLEESLSSLGLKMISKLRYIKEGLMEAFNRELGEFLYVVDKVQKVAIYYDTRYAAEKGASPTTCIGYQVAKKHLESEDGHILQMLVQSIVDTTDEYRAGRYADYLQIRTCVQNLVGGLSPDGHRHEDLHSVRERAKSTRFQVFVESGRLHPLLRACLPDKSSGVSCSPYRWFGGARPHVQSRG